MSSRSARSPVFGARSRGGTPEDRLTGCLREGTLGPSLLRARHKCTQSCAHTSAHSGDQSPQSARLTEAPGCRTSGSDQGSCTGHPHTHTCSSEGDGGHTGQARRDKGQSALLPRPWSLSKEETLEAGPRRLSLPVHGPRAADGAAECHSRPSGRWQRFRPRTNRPGSWASVGLAQRSRGRTRPFGTAAIVLQKGVLLPGAVTGP